MPAQFWRAVLNSPGVGAATPFTNSTTLTDISPAPQLVIPANYLYVNQRLRVTAYGIYSTTGTPTVLLGVYYGGVAGTALAAMTATAQTTTAANWPWQLFLEIYVRSTGSSGTVWCNGNVSIGQSLAGGVSGDPRVYQLPSTQTQPVTVNTTTANALTVGMQWGAASASNTITCEDAYIEALS